VNISIGYDSDEVTVYVDGLPPFHYLKKHYRGMQAYNNGIHTIEILLKDQNLRLEYDKREMWVSVLTHLHDAL